MFSPCSAGQTHPITYFQATHNHLSSTAPVASDTPGEVEDCSICITPLHTECVTTLPCNHTFHTRCLDQWVRTLAAADVVQRDGPDDNADEQYYDTVVMPIQTASCAMCRGMNVQYLLPTPSRFLTNTIQGTIDLLRAGATIRFEPRSSLIGHTRWLQDPIYQDFHRTLLQDPTFNVPPVQADRPEGSIIFREVQVVRPGALRVHQPNRRFQIMLLSAQEIYYYLSAMYHHGWDVSRGRLRPQLDLLAFQNRPLAEVIMHALDRQVLKITQLDLHTLYPAERFLQGGRIPHIQILTFNDGNVVVYFLLGDWDNHGEDDFFGYDTEPAETLLARLRGPDPNPTPSRPRSIDWVVRDRNMIVSNDYDLHLSLYERFPRITPARNLPMGYDPVWSAAPPAASSNQPTDGESIVIESDNDSA